MIFGGLSEKEVEKIREILELANIPYQVAEDEVIKETNEESMKYDLRHLNSPSISTHILSIKIEDHHFDQMDETTHEKLLGLGITNKAPEGFSQDSDSSDNVEESVSKLRGKILEGNKRLVGFENLYLLIFSIVVVLIISFASSFFNFFGIKKVSYTTEELRVLEALDFRSSLRLEDKRKDIQELKLRELKTQEKKTIQFLIERLEIQEIDNAFKSLLEETPLELKSETLSYIKNFSFLKAFTTQIKRFPKQDIYRLGEIEKGTISSKLFNLSSTIEDDVDKYNQDPNFPSFSATHYNKVKLIINYINEYDSMISFQRNMLVSIAMLQHISDFKTSREDLEKKSLLSIQDYLNKQKQYIRRVVDISYYRLSESELEQYLEFLKKHNASKFLKKYDAIFERIFYQFTDEVFEIETTESHGHHH